MTEEAEDFSMLISMYYKSIGKVADAEGIKLSDFKILKMAVEAVVNSVVQMNLGGQADKGGKAATVMSIFDGGKKD